MAKRLTFRVLERDVGSIRYRVLQFRNVQLNKEKLVQSLESYINELDKMCVFVFANVVLMYLCVQCPFIGERMYFTLGYLKVHLVLSANRFSAFSVSQV